MRFEFDIPDGGWALAVFSAGGRRYEFAVSALSDAPGDLLGATVALLRGEDDARVTFMQEPGEVVAVFRRLSGDHLRLKLFHGADWGEADTEGDEPVFTADVSLAQFARQVAAEFSRIERELGPDGYRARWVSAGFPGDELRSLQALVRV